MSSRAPSDRAVDDREEALKNVMQVLPGDVKIKASDGEIWANKALLSTSSEYFSAMLDEEKFKEGQEGVGDLELYSMEVVSMVINYFYSGEIKCQVTSMGTFHPLNIVLPLGPVSVLSPPSRGAAAEDPPPAPVSQDPGVHQDEDLSQVVLYP